MSDQCSRLQEVIDSLLGPEGCPWDKKQTPESLCDYVLEEAFELVDEIRSKRPEGAMEELGDVFFLLLFIARLYEDEGNFSLEDALAYSSAKMIRRHPHVFASAKVDGQEDVLKNWERIKRNEKKNKDDSPAGVFESLPGGLPPLLKAYRIHSKAARVGFTWESDTEVEEQLASEWQEFAEAREAGDQEAMDREFGDYIFTLAELGRRHKIKANAALHLANIKFLDRFTKMEAMARAKGKDIADLSLAEQNELWGQVKGGE